MCLSPLLWSIMTDVEINVLTWLRVTKMETEVHVFILLQVLYHIRDGSGVLCLKVHQEVRSCDWLSAGGLAQSTLMGRICSIGSGVAVTECWSLHPTVCVTYMQLGLYFYYLDCCCCYCWYQETWLRPVAASLWPHCGGLPLETKRPAPY